MGDRANIVLEFHDSKNSELYLYTHWNGYEWPEELRKALLAGKSRWSDESYLARIITSNVFADIHDDVTGGGISPYETDNEHPHIRVDLVKSTVTIDSVTLTFDEYVALSPATYELIKEEPVPETVSFKYYLRDDYSRSEAAEFIREQGVPEALAETIADARPFYEVTLDCVWHTAEERLEIVSAKP